MLSAQLPLGLALLPRASFEQFWPGDNRQLVDCLRRIGSGEDEPFVYVWGESGLGKSHLLQATSQAAHAAGRRVSYLPMALVAEHGPDLFDGLDEQDLVAIDDIDRVLGDTAFEEPLFRLYNALRDRGRTLLASASSPPSDLPTRLPDLASRLSWGLVFRLKPLGDEDTLIALGLYAGELGLDLPAPVGRFLLAHHRRDMASLRRTVDALDRETLAAKRKLSVPFVKQFLERAR